MPNEAIPAGAAKSIIACAVAASSTYASASPIRISDLDRVGPPAQKGMNMARLTKAARNLKPGDRLCKRCSGSGIWIEKTNVCYRCNGLGTERDTVDVRGQDGDKSKCPLMSR